MTDFSAARTHMVDSQIHTMGVVNESVLEAFRTVPREDFVPDEKRGVAYNDEDLPLGGARVLMEPVTHARLLQAAAPVANDSVLDVGGATGYSAAILGKVVNKVVCVESDAALLAKGEANWRRQGYGNIVPHQGKITDGCATHGAYSLIVVNGSVSEIPQGLLGQLAPGGRLVAIIRGKADKIGKAVLVQKSADGATGERVLFDAAVPYLPGTEPRNEFVF
jgi:protein-L-isoaspartate(D-aspartate) O-methyltransferase